MNSILNINSIQTTKNFLNYIEHRFSGTIAGGYNLLGEKGKSVLRMRETLTAMFKKLCREIKIEFIRAVPDSTEKT